MKESILDLLKDPSYKERKIDQIARVLHQDDTENYIAFIKLMNSLEDQGDVIRDRNNNYHVLDENVFFKGKLEVNKKGFGFVRVEEDRDFYINEKHMKDAYHGDYVLVQKIPNNKGDKEEGQILRVLERGVARYVGEVKHGRKDCYVQCDDPRFTNKIFVDAAHLHGAMPGHKVVVEIKSYKPQIRGDIKEIIGHKNDPGVDILSIVHAHDVDIEFPEEVYQYIENIPDEIDQSDIKNRIDLRDTFIVTIDGDDAKDLDDAISLRRLPNHHYELGVHIADVSYYVKEDSVLDKEAFKRGTSIYLVDRVIPMLPHKLSNGICSLNEHVDRYTISCMMELDQRGHVVDHKIMPTIINSNHRMTYKNVNRIINGEDLPEYNDAKDMFFLMKEVAEILNKKRKRRGAIDFDTNEAVIHVNDEGTPIDISLRTRGESEHFIEEFMLCANETIAEHFKWMEVPFIYRVHEDPKQKKLQQFVNIARPLGYKIHGSLDHIKPRELAKVVEQSVGKPEHPVISTLLLRCMQKARYDAQCLGHFGLADEFYTHFTSPIRRYPDLLVHRLIRTYLFENKFDKIGHYEEVIPYMAEHSSQREKVAIDTEYDVEDMKKAEFMLNHIGETFKGVISSVTGFGFFVELDNTVEGLVHMTTLRDDYYVYNEDQMMLVGERTGKQYRLGDEVVVTCVDVNKVEKKVDFEVKSDKKRRRSFKDKKYSKKKSYRKKPQKGKKVYNKKRKG
jgi:ribonuclease R